MFSIKAQGTVEYLVIISIVVTISLVVVGISTGIIGGNVDSSAQASAKLSWLTKEISVTDAVVGSNGTAIFILKSNLNDFITITSLEIDGSAPKTLEGGAGKRIGMGEVYSAQVSGVAPCTGQGKKYSIKINYLSSNNLSKSVPAGDFYASCYGNLPFLLFSGTPISGAMPIGDGSGSFSSSGSAITGLLVLRNALCFGGTTCDANISLQGTDIVFAE